MNKLLLVDSNNKVLHTKCDKFTFDNPPFDPIEFSHLLVKTMYDYNGLGLSANQVYYEEFDKQEKQFIQKYIPYQIFAMRGSPENFVCFNPILVNPSEEEILLEEGCLSYPSLFVKIKRPRHIRVRFTKPNGEVQTNTFTGLTARIFLHEMDHGNGETFYKKANYFHKEQALRKWEKNKRLLKKKENHDG